MNPRGSCWGNNILYICTLFATSFCVLNACPYQPDSSVTCEPVLSRRCQSLDGGIGHNSTSFPNRYGHTSQREVEEFLARSFLLHLIDINCSPYTAHLICSAVYPLCYHEQFDNVEPCREMCVEVRDSCGAVLQSVQWPEQLNCDLFPPFGTKLCVSNGNSNGNANCGPVPSITVEQPRNIGDFVSSSGEPNCTGELLALGKNSGTSFGGRKDCIEPCHGVYFEQHQNMLLTICTTCLSVVNFGVSVFIFLTYILNFKSIHRLESPIYYISLCYAVLGLTNLISMALGRDSLICDHTLQNSFNQSALVDEGLSHPLCSTLFSIAYYFTLCSWMWWCALTLQWFLFNMREKEISFCLVICFHVITWGTPFIFLLVVLGVGGFSGNPVTQMCWIHKKYEVPFIILPLAASLLFCSVLVLLRHVCVLSPQNKRLLYLEDTTNPHGSPPKPSSLFKISLYIIVFLSVMGILFCCYFYGFWYREAWEKLFLMCSSKTSLQTCDLLPKSSKPSLPVYLAQVSTSVCMGFLSVMWVLREDLMKAWKKTCGVFCIWKTRARDLEFEVRTPETPPGGADLTLKDIENYEETVH